MWLLMILTACVTLKDSTATTCTSSDDLGNSNVNSLSQHLSSNSDENYFMTDSEYYSPCCGIISQWTIYAGRTGNVTFQVWRPVTSSSATLVGENAISVVGVGVQTFSITSTESIDVQQGDFIGWFNEGQTVVEYKQGGSQNDNNYIESIAMPSVGDTVSYSNDETDRTYAIYAGLDGKPAPTLNNLDDSITLYASTVSTTTTLFTVTSSSGSPTYSLDNITPSSHFSVSSSTGEVKATTTSVSTTTYTLTIGVVEPCSYSTNGMLTIVVASTAPVWSNLDTDISIFKNSASSVAFTALATNPIADGPVTYSLDSISPSSDFAVDANTGNVTATTSSLAATTYTIVIIATDKYGNYANGTLTLTVVNRDPEILSLPSVSHVSESAVDETLLHTVNVTDADGDPLTCILTSTPSGPFTSKYLSVNGILLTGLYLEANPGLNYSATNSYELSVTCSDDSSGTDTAILYVYVAKNQVPVITNLQNTTSILSTTPFTTVIFNVLATDAEGDQTYFTLTCSVAVSCPFSIYTDGSVTLATSLISTNINAYEIDITVYDDYSSSGTHRLTIFVADLNTVPSLSNLPATIQIAEDIVVGTTVFDTSVYDEDGDKLHTFTALFSPASSVGLFQLNSSTGEITLKNTLNYLTQDNNYSITLQVSDAQTTSTAAILQIEVVDVNRPPVLYQTNYQVEIDEGSAGTSAPDPGYNVYDADSDTFTYSFGGGNDTSGFLINSTTGMISFSIDFDAEDTTSNTLYVWLIVISDPEGLSTTATLTLSIKDANDNIPSFTSSNYAAVVYSNARLATVILTVSSTDTDISAEFRDLEYSIHSTSLFRIDHYGNIFVTENLANYVDTIENFYIRVRNPDVNSYDTANIDISIIKEPDNNDYFDNGANIAWVTLVCIFVPPCLIALAYLCYRGYQAWKASSLTNSQVTQVAPHDTRMLTPYTPPKTRASLVTRGTPVTPSDVRVINESWEAWKLSSWREM